MLTKNHSYHNCIYNLPLINFTKLGTHKQCVVNSKIIDNWENKRYIKASIPVQCMHGRNASNNGYLWWNTKM